MKDVISSLMATSTSTLATAERDSAPWLPAADLDVYVQEFQRTGFQGMLNWYRVLMDLELMGELQLWAGKRVEVPAMFVGGDRDWDIYQVPGALEGLSEINKRWYGVTILRECGHYPQLEQPEELANIALGFLSEIRDRR
jgi:pimeloyl-ACP methyl ester carboxylesterase